MSNFEFLKTIPQYALFAPAAVDAEPVYASSPAMCAVGSRKALELAVKWVYSADNTIEQPYRDNLQSLIHEPSFRFAMDANTWRKLLYIIRLGNNAVHTGQQISKSDVILSLKGLFEFVEWIDYCYGDDYVERFFDENLIPKEKVIVDEKKIREQEILLNEKDEQIKALLAKVKEMSEAYTASRDEHKQDRSFTAEDISEYDPEQDRSS